jgi:hypothetical protein
VDLFYQNGPGYTTKEGVVLFWGEAQNNTTPLFIEKLQIITIIDD